MKKIILLVAAVLVSISSFANNKNPKESRNQELRQEIITLLDNPQFVVENSDIIANIEFTLNTKNEIVVLNVDSEKEIVASYVKSRLNYQKVNFEAKKTIKTFKMKLKVIKPKA